jgi:hypothetical protein
VRQRGTIKKRSEAMVQVNLDHPAKVFWVPSQIVSTTVSGGSDLDFESLRSAIFFVMERLPEFERATAFVNTDEPGGHYPIEKIKSQCF